MQSRGAFSIGEQPDRYPMGRFEDGSLQMRTFTEPRVAVVGCEEIERGPRNCCTGR
ncbi:MAG: hypothetical protein OEW19_00920 [Acidobacteriota bacterium]|nr:hypothetical protein [Acidobacteriota bacterium]